MLNLCTYNVLAPCWAELSCYPTSSVPYLDRIKRRNIIINNLKNLSQSIDIFALQETQDDELIYFQSVMNELGFDGFKTNHHDNYWESYKSIDLPFISNGVVLFWKKETIKMIDIGGYEFSGDGNRGIIGHFVKDNKNFSITCIHLDTDNGNRKEREINSIMSLLPQDEMIDIVLGDFNFDIYQAQYMDVFRKNNFIDILETINKDAPTYPYVKNHELHNHGAIDHVMVRHAIPVSGQIIDFNSTIDAKDQEDRMNLTLQRVGSDHFIVSSSINY